MIDFFWNLELHCLPQVDESILNTIDELIDSFIDLSLFISRINVRWSDGWNNTHVNI